LSKDAAVSPAHQGNPYVFKHRVTTLVFFYAVLGIRRKLRLVSRKAKVYT